MSVTDWLDAAKARADAATGGPWKFDCDSALGSIWADVPGNREEVAQANYDSDGEFIAAARTDLPKALDALRAVLGELERLDQDPGAVQPVVVTGGVVRAAIATALGVTP